MTVISGFLSSARTSSDFNILAQRNVGTDTEVRNTKCPNFSTLPLFSVNRYAYCVWLLHKYEAHIKGLPICFSEVQVKNDVTDNNNKHFVTAFEGECRNIIELREHLKLCFLIIASAPALLHEVQLAQASIHVTCVCTYIDTMYISNLYMYQKSFEVPTMWPHARKRKYYLVHPVTQAQVSEV